MRSLAAFALVLAACSKSDRSTRSPSAAASPPSTSAGAARGPDALVLRVPRSGGIPHTYAYPNIDSVVWTATDAAPALARVLAFDADAGLVAAVDTRDRPLWIDLRIGTVTFGSQKAVRDLSSVDGTSIYGIGSDGAIARFTPPGNWVRNPPLPARAAFPQIGGTLVVLGGRGTQARAWRMHPPAPDIGDSTVLPGAVNGIGAPLGDQIYVATGDRSLVGLNARSLAKGRTITFPHPIRAVASSPSGDRFYVVTDSSHELQIISRFADRVTARVQLPGQGHNVRVDPFGRYVLVRSATGDSVWVVGVGNDRVLSTVHSIWRADLPLVAPDGKVAVVDGADVSLVDALSGREVRRVSGGAADFWYPLMWSGFRPRAAARDQPARFPTDSDSSRTAPVTADTVAAAAPLANPDSTKLGFTVSFAVLLDASAAQSRAAKIVVDGTSARVVTGVTAGTAVYRVVLGPFPTRDAAEQAGRASGQPYVVYAGAP